jgi:hypothetical protein
MTAQREITAEDLICGSASTFDAEIPGHILRPGSQGEQGGGMTVRLRPLSIGTFQLIMRAARQDPGLIPILMIKESLVQPEMSLDQVKRLHLGLVNFLISHIREISGLTEKKRLWERK